MQAGTDRRTLRIAVIRGDGIGPEVVDAALPAIADAAAHDGVTLACEELDWGGDRMIRTGSAMPADALDVARAHDAILFGAIGHPEVDPAVSVWSLVLPLRKGLQLYANLRPVVGWEGIWSPARDGARVDFLVVRENTEGEYSGIGGRAHEGTPQEVATEVAIHSRAAIERIARCAFQHAAERADTLTLATKSNVNRHGYGLWDEVVFGLGASEFPHVELEKMYVDALATRMVSRPETLGVVLAGNLFGDILGPRRAVRGRSRDGAERQRRPRPRRAGLLRAGPRLGARHRRQGDRQPARDRAVRRDAAARERLPGGRGRAGAGGRRGRPRRRRDDRPRRQRDDRRGRRRGPRGAQRTGSAVTAAASGAAAGSMSGAASGRPWRCSSRS